MKIFYCPKCNKEVITNDDIYKSEYTISNIRDGYGRPIRHYKCECGNYLAGSMNISGYEDNKDFIEYCKYLIKEYNKDGCFYNSEANIFDRAKRVYEEKKRNEKIIK